MRPAGKGKDWHHIVEQCQANKSGFDVQYKFGIDVIKMFGGM